MRVPLDEWQRIGLRRAFKMLVATCDDHASRPVTPQSLMVSDPKLPPPELIDDLIITTYGMMNVARILVAMLENGYECDSLAVLAQLSDIIERENTEEK